jgi:hypothetical protein
MTNGRKPRYQFYELFDAGNIDDQGGVLDPNSPRAHYGKVVSCPVGPLQVANQSQRATSCSTSIHLSTLVEQATQSFVLWSCRHWAMEATLTSLTLARRGMI